MSYRSDLKAAGHLGPAYQLALLNRESTGSFDSTVVPLTMTQPVQANGAPKSAVMFAAEVS